MNVTTSILDGTSIALAPLLPWAFLAPLFVVALAILLLAMVRRARGVWLRTLAVAVLALGGVYWMVREQDRRESGADAGDSEPASRFRGE